MMTMSETDLRGERWAVASARRRKKCCRASCGRCCRRRRHRGRRRQRPREVPSPSEILRPSEVISTTASRELSARFSRRWRKKNRAWPSPLSRRVHARFIDGCGGLFKPRDAARGFSRHRNAPECAEAEPDACRQRDHVPAAIRNWLERAGERERRGEGGGPVLLLSGVATRNSSTGRPERLPLLSNVVTSVAITNHGKTPMPWPKLSASSVAPSAECPRGRRRRAGRRSDSRTSAAVSRAGE